MKIAILSTAFENLGIEYISASVKREGHHVAFLLDPQLFDDVVIQNQLVAKLFSYKKQFFNKLKELNPEVVLLPVATNYYEWACEMSRRVRETVPHSKIILGGIHVSSVPDIVIKNDFVDYAVVGEGDEAIVELLDYLQSGRTDCKVKNVWFKKGNQIIKNPVRPLVDINALPFPDKEMFRQYGPDKRLGYIIMCSRGCIHNCSYCNHNILHRYYPSKGYVRYRSPSNVISELEKAKGMKGVHFIRFFDDDFLFNIPWLKKFIPLYKKRINLPYSCIVNPQSVTEEAMEVIKGSRCVQMNIGFQSASARIRRKILHRPEKNEDAARAIKLTKKAGIRCIMDNMLGIPGTTEEDHNIIFEFFYQNRPNRIFMPYLQFFPRTCIIKYAKEYGMLDKKKIYDLETKPYTKTLISMDKSIHEKNIAKFQMLMVMLHYSKHLAHFMYKSGIYKKIPSIPATFLNLLCYLRASSNYELVEIRNRMRYLYYPMKKLLGRNIYKNIGYTTSPNEDAQNYPS